MSNDNPGEGKAGWWVCQNCGDKVKLTQPTESWNCVECGAQMEHQSKSDIVPKDELRELVEECYDRAHEETMNQNRTAAWRLEQCAGELEELISDE